MRTPIIRFDVPLSRFTTFGIGGPARLLVDARSSDEVVEAVRWARGRDLRLFLLGRGSNVLVADEGFDGLVVRNARADRIELLDGDRLRADSGVELARLVELTVAHGLSGLEHFAGIPSTLGGALWQNLHFLSADRSRLVFIGDLVEEATVLEGDAVRRVPPAWFDFGYDESTLRHGSAIVLDATLRLTPADHSTLRAKVDANLAWRTERHPAAAETRSAGCVFRNPGASSAARAIDAAGMKGHRVGGAVVSRRHANFVLNAGGATAADVRTLIDVVAERVARNSELRLEPEIAFVSAVSHRTQADSIAVPSRPR